MLATSIICCYDPETGTLSKGENMCGFRWGRRKPDTSTASTFVEATGGGWGDAPSVMSVDGGEHADYVGEVLRRARDYAMEQGVAIGDDFTYTLTDIPRGITSPHEIIIGLMTRARDFGLDAGIAFGEEITFTRTR